jgi:adenosine deaminase/aminodeoxyfutalosine deaminase
MDLSFPKAELHLHLEGAIDLVTLSELARRHGMPEPPADLYQYDDFLGFLGAFKQVTLHLRTPEDYALAAERLLERLAGENVRYAEIYYSAGICLRKGMEVGAIYEALAEAGRQAPLEVRWIFDAVRQFGPEAAAEVTRWAVKCRDRGVVGIGIGGDEAEGLPRLFRRAYEMARAEGLRLTAHAGETTGPETIWETIRELGVDRIGHGCSAVQDPELMAYLRERQIPLEVSVTSNYATGAVAAGAEHPVRRMFEEGLRVVINTDDPEMFHTTLSEEYRRLVERHGFTETEVRRLARNAFDAAFVVGCSPGGKA